jgi:hypothetical protein
MMELKIIEVQQQRIAEVVAEGIVIHDAQDTLDLMASAGYYGARSIILAERNLDPAFFELQTGIAGEILQKFSNYHMKLAVVGKFEQYESKSLQAFIAESNRGRQIFFVPDREAAIDRITGS